MIKNSRYSIVFSVGVLFLVSSAKAATKPKQGMPDGMVGFYGLIEGKVLLRATKGVTLLATSVEPWRESTAKAPQAVRGKRIFIAFTRQGPKQTTSPVQLRFIRKVRPGSKLKIAVSDNGGGLCLLALSRTQQGLKETNPWSGLWSGRMPGRTRKPTRVVRTAISNPVVYYDTREQTVFCGNGLMRVRPSHYGIIWFDYHHPGEKKWYVNKNNLNLMTLAGGKWNNTEGDVIIPRVEILSEGGTELQLRYHYAFPNGARMHMDLSLKKGKAEAAFSVHSKSDSKPIAGFQWHITNGQSEAVAQLEFDKTKLLAKDFKLPLPGKRLKVQKMQRFRNIKELVFKFSGKATSRPDPNNPFWMGRVLGLKQEVIWGKPMRDKDDFAYEARDQPWQPDWKVPKTIPWFEGLHFVRKPFLEGDSLTYRMNNYKGIARGRTTIRRR